MLSQDLDNDYGKIIKININNKVHEIFSYGHRNPQGLYIDKNKNIFSTEHGPSGGDEVNPVSYTHLRAHETPEHLLCRLQL